MLCLTLTYNDTIISYSNLLNGDNTAMNAQQQHPKKNINSLPPELHANIVEALIANNSSDVATPEPLQDVFNLSLVSRYYNKVANPVIERALQSILDSKIHPPPWTAKFENQRQARLQTSPSFDTENIVGELDRWTYDQSRPPFHIPQSLTNTDLDLVKDFFKATSPISFSSHTSPRYVRYRQNSAHGPSGRPAATLHTTTSSKRQFLATSKIRNGLGWVKDVEDEVSLTDVDYLWVGILACLLKSMDFELIDLQERRRIGECVIRISINGRERDRREGGDAAE
ncbi:uncharacterized protein KY384_003993 [Bacidia gigantensis]|uniref:uncharacterized protein n=1 Tax=Bacidia gigantensis TaxID=2732470 RepID=UPI001D0430A0|nr:uncharacterized protein KY384_003993 [Bacidia gigantensis]KAG8531282.1 hypothetical protein KY384_003993 [Bacidia gigantensis]